MQFFSLNEHVVAEQVRFGHTLIEIVKLANKNKDKKNDWKFNEKR